jgi:predicted nucleotidyltransferase
MRDKSQIKKTLLEQKDTLLAEYGVREIGLFGSLAKGIASPTSDIDILIDFYKSVDLFTFIDLKNRLSELLDAEVDLVMKTGLKPRIGERILSEVEYI